ncbi:MAG: hypothetical protein H0X29_07805 [Parachlamydiaceae bacterium]|nr:hypothetical protein [Parachlamydiaceae bacterium]
MDPIEFHKKLNFYSQADDPQDLATKIFGAPQQDIVVYSAVAVKVMKAIEQFLSENAKQISLYDLPALRELQHNVERLSIWTKGALEKEDYKYLRTLEKTLAASIKLTKNNADLAINPDSEISLDDILSVADEYHSFLDLIKLCMIGKYISPALLKKTAARINETGMREFINEADMRRESDPHIFKEIMRLFFLHAPLYKQAYFFSLVNNETFLEDIISALPRDITQLDLGECPSLRDQHIENMVSRLNNLQSLNLTGCNLLTDATAVAIARSPNMINLQELHFHLSPLLSDASAWAIAESVNMANLKTLIFSCINMTDIAALAIAYSPHMTKLQSLSFSGSPSVTDEGAIAIATSPNMSNMQSLCFAGCRELSNAAVIAISNSIYMANLRILYLNGCESLTDIAAISIASSAHLNHLQELNVMRCAELTDEAARAFSESLNLQNLKTLCFSGCTRLTDTTILWLIESPHLPNLLNLNFWGCDLITPEALESLKKSRRERLAALADK